MANLTQADIMAAHRIAEQCNSEADRLISARLQQKDDSAQTALLIQATELRRAAQAITHHAGSWQREAASEALPA